MIKELIKKINTGFLTKIGRCLTDEDIACLLEKKISQKERSSFLSHLSTCKDCAHRLKAQITMMNCVNNEPQLAVPDYLIERAENLVETKEAGKFDVIVARTA